MILYSQQLVGHVDEGFKGVDEIMLGDRGPRASEDPKLDSWLPRSEMSQSETRRMGGLGAISNRDDGFDPLLHRSAKSQRCHERHLETLSVFGV